MNFSSSFRKNGKLLAQFQFKIRIHAEGRLQHFLIRDRTDEFIPFHVFSLHFIMLGYVGCAVFIFGVFHVVVELDVGFLVVFQIIQCFSAIRCFPVQ